MLINWAHRLYYAQPEWLNNLNEQLDYILADWPRWARIVQQKILDRQSGVRKVDPVTAMRLPDLGLPRMSRDARKAFASVLSYDDGLSPDVLQLAAARGFTVHPCDWVPDATDHPQYPDLYQPWAGWLADKGYTRYTAAVPLTQKNEHRFDREARKRAFRNLYGRDRQAAYDLLFQLSDVDEADTRYDLLNEIGGGALFHGCYPSDVPTLKHFLKDSSQKVRDLAQAGLHSLAGMETVEAVAQHIAKYLEVTDDLITPVAPEYREANLSVARLRTTVDALAMALNISAMDLVRLLSFELLKSDFWPIIVNTGSVEVRTIVAQRMIAEGHNGERGLYRNLPRSLWEQGLRATFQSQYVSAINDFLGPDLGTLDTNTIRDHRAFQDLERSVLRELETGQLPVNTRWDELRVLGLALNKPAAEQVRRKVIDLGMAPDNPRLAMLKYNLLL